eukprot:symbB.v1.2.038323.t1/scaffold5929.1/size22372/3
MMKQVCGQCSACEERKQETRGKDLDLVAVTLDDRGLARNGKAPTILKGREVKLTPGHFGLENCCGEENTITLPTVPEIWEVINEDTFTTSPKVPGQQTMESTQGGGAHSTLATLESVHNDPGARMINPEEMPWATVGEFAGGFGIPVQGAGMAPTRSLELVKQDWCIPGHRMDDTEMLEKLWWISWCCCMGVGVSRYSAPLGVTFNCLCANSSCQTTKLREQQGSCCGTFTELCCCSCMCRGPPMYGDPRCVCCCIDLCGLVGSTAREDLGPDQKKSRLGAIDESLSRAWVPCWCCCCGNRVAVPNNCIDTYIKCLWCEYYFSTGLPSVEAGICLHLVNCWCCYSLGKCPPTGRFNPICACCGCLCIDTTKETKL